MSSYTPTVTAIVDRIKSDFPVEKAVSGLFLTNQPEVPQQPRILETTREVRAVYAKAKSEGVRVHKVEGSEITPEECLDYMERFSAVHLACHAHQEVEHPLKSRFLFHKGVLYLSDIMKRDLKHADLAFLSACQTSTVSEKPDAPLISGETSFNGPWDRVR